MQKKSKKFVYLLSFLMAIPLIGCGKKDGPVKPGPDDNPPTPTPTESFSYYKNTKLSKDSTVKVISDVTNDGDRLYTAQAIEGLFARKEVKYYVDSNYVTNGVNTDQYYIKKASDKYGFKYESTTLKEAVLDYVASWSDYVKNNTWGSQISLDSYNNLVGVNAYTEKNKDGFATPGYIVYRPGDVSVNTAATLAAITGFLPVSKDDVSFYQELGLTEKFNLDNAALTYRWLFNIVMPELSTSGLIHQNYNDNTGKTNKFIKDYGICNKYFHVYYDDVSSVSNSFKKNLHSFLDANSPIFGYAYSEDRDVAFFSQYGQFLVPTDYTCNLTFHAADLFKHDKFSQPNKDYDKKAEQGKHYVAFVVSDGDNATYWQNTAGFATNYMNAAGRDKDNFPVTWSITPALADLAPDVLDEVYNSMSNGYDYFCAPVSGQGYINAGNFASQNNGEYFKDFTEKLDIYMKKADLRNVTVIGGNSQNDLVNVLKGYASSKQVEGGIVYDGSKYFGSVQGGVIWIDGKPFVGPRDSLWETTPAYIAARLNTYEKDITSINGYSIINVHPWSHSYDDIRTIVNMLNDDIEVCSVDRIIKMMTDNIVDKSNTTSFKIPEKNGVSINEDYLRQNPSLIPVDPLYNDFLLWQEDWKGSGITYNSTDKACSNVGAIYKGNISINKGSVATKKSFTLPEIDNYWLSFNARCDSLTEVQSSSFKATLKVGEESKVIINKATLKGVRGTESQIVYGDGWQCFAIPLSQYFKDYKGKKCELSIEVLADSDAGIRLDQVSFKARTVDPKIDLSTVNPYNNTFTNSTEDWMLGEQYKTSQYYWWDVIDRESLKPTNSLQIDCSDGGGDEKRNGNTNIWMAKNYVLPESSDINLSWVATSDNDTGAKMKISLYADGRYYVLFDWNVARESLNNTKQNINLNTLDSEVNWSNKEVTIIFEARDGGRNNGVGEACKLSNFTTIGK